MIDKKKVIKLIEERTQELDEKIYLVDLSISSSNVIHVAIDKTEGRVSIEECIAVSRNIEKNLDREREDFELNVSSAGLDRPLIHWNQYRKHRGKRVKVITIEGKKVEGQLVEVEGDYIKLQNERVEKIQGTKKKQKIVEEVILPFKQIKETKIVISFN
ncbi:MAG: ribosome assembly cofactor RimP [Bacteroidetes bacterium]|nr:ribosome assembly cofactor RimP [Bacteroidota bacterium]